nr:hypothetical protein GCM10020093_106290 [Planobispora longispora]
MESIMRAAGNLLGTELSTPVDLGGSRRSTVLRCRTAGGGSVIVKSFSDDPRGCAASSPRRPGSHSGWPVPSCWVWTPTCRWW